MPSMPMLKRIGLFTFSFCLLTLYFSCEKDFSPVKIITPPETTSHNFTWTIDTFGIGGRGSSYLLDVAIVNENDIWAVGEIHTAETDTFDSLANWVPPFNAVHWNGQQWELVRFIKQDGNVILPIRGILHIDWSHAWLAAGSIYFWNGNSNKRADLSYQRDITTGELVQRLWGASNSSIYGVGSEGIVVHYDGSDWQKLNSGTTVDIQDIWGAMNPKSGEYEILAVASFGPFPPQAKQLLSIQETNVTIVPDSGLALSLSGIWFVPGEIYYVVGDGVFHTEEIGQFWQSDTTHPLLYKVGVRGNAANDIFITGSFGLVSHYNGSTWHHYTGNELPNISGGYGKASLKLNCLATVGRIGDQAIILRGIRN